MAKNFLANVFNVVKITEYNYSYTFIILIILTNMKPCERKQITFTAAVSDYAAVETVEVIGNSKKRPLYTYSHAPE